MHKVSTRFGDMLRFWRQYLNISQEDLSLELDISRKHLSFLETGKSSPSIDLALKIAAALRLKERYVNNLLAAAGFMNEVPNSAESDDLWRKKSITIMLRGLDPIPCVVRDRYGYVIALNRSWLAYTQHWLGDFIFESELNVNRLLFHEKGWQKYAENIGEVGRQGMSCLKQELLLAHDDRANSLYHEMLTYPWVSKQLKEKSDGVPPMNVFNLSLKTAYGYETSTVIATTFTEDPVIQPRLLIETWFPRDFTPPFTAAELQADQSLQHPLLFY